MKLCYTLVFCCFAYVVSAQNIKEILPGKWKLTSLVNKKTSPIELSKRYHFTTTDSLYFSSSKVQIAMQYQIDEAAQKIKLIRKGMADSYLSVKIISADKIEIKDLNLENSAAGILEREKE